MCLSPIVIRLVYLICQNCNDQKQDIYIPLYYSLSSQRMQRNSWSKRLNRCSVTPHLESTQILPCDLPLLCDLHCLPVATHIQF